VEYSEPGGDSACSASLSLAGTLPDGIQWGWGRPHLKSHLNQLCRNFEIVLASGERRWRAAARNSPLAEKRERQT